MAGEPKETMLCLAWNFFTACSVRAPKKAVSCPGEPEPTVVISVALSLLSICCRTFTCAFFVERFKLAVRIASFFAESGAIEAVGKDVFVELATGSIEAGEPLPVMSPTTVPPPPPEDPEEVPEVHRLEETLTTIVLCPVGGARRASVEAEPVQVETIPADAPDMSTLRMLRLGALTEKIEPGNITIEKLLAPTVTDWSTAELPDIATSIPPTLSVALDVMETSLYAAKAKAGERAIAANATRVSVRVIYVG